MANLPVGTTIYEWQCEVPNIENVYTDTLSPTYNTPIYNIYGEQLSTIGYSEISSPYVSIYVYNYPDSQSSQTGWSRLISDTSSTTVQPLDVSNLSDGTNTYAIKDAKAAKKDLDNLTSIGKNITNWSSNTTNCISEIPQDIKLEINNGTLTLKAGSKVYVPNGSGVFDEVIITQDKTYTPTWLGNLKEVMLVFNPTTNGFNGLSQSQFFSGTTQPTMTDQYNVWYDTTNNKIKFTSNTGTTWQDGWSFPICLFSNTNNVLTSIDKVFNGFGYIGSTVFALPGVKCLAPNGRNDDGTLKSIKKTISNVLTSTFVESRDNWQIFLRENGSLRLSSGITYLEDVNYNFYDAQNAYVKDCYLGNIKNDVSLNIYYFQPKTPFHALDWNDKPTISGWSMPSNKYNTLTFGASGTNYTAPANGYFLIMCYILSGNWCQISSSTGFIAHTSAGASGDFSLFCPVRVGDVVTLNYTGTSLPQAWNFFRFYYSEGDNV